MSACAWKCIWRGPGNQKKKTRIDRTGNPPRSWFCRPVKRDETPSTRGTPSEAGLWLDRSWYSSQPISFASPFAITLESGLGSVFPARSVPGAFATTFAIPHGVARRYQLSGICSGTAQIVPSSFNLNPIRGAIDERVEVPPAP